MDIIEKAAYLKGLIEGADLGFTDKQQKIVDTLVDLLVDLAETVNDHDVDLDEVTEAVNDMMDDIDDITEAVECISDELDEMEDDLDDIVDELDEIEDDLDLVFDDEDDDEDDYDEDEDEEELYDVECPNCHQILSVDEDILIGGAFSCPSCGEKLEFEIPAISEDEEEEEE